MTTGATLSGPSLASWFLDRKLGEGYKDTLDQSDWCLMFLCNQAWISLLRLPEPKASKKTVLKVFFFFFFYIFIFFITGAKKKTFTYKKLNAYLSLLGKEKKYTKQMKHKELSLIGIKSNFSHTTIYYTLYIFILINFFCNSNAHS